MSVIDVDTERAGYHDFLDSRRTMVLSTTDADGHPFISYAPFVVHDGSFHVYVSRIAEHYWHLVNLDRVSGLLIADEKDSPNLFARHRVRFECAVTRLDDPDEGTDTDPHEDVFALFAERFNASLITLLRTLDFSLFRLTPLSGRYVVGFGKAFDVDLAGSRFDHVVVDKRQAEIREQDRRGRMG
ncbi:MAG TPA: pyridoxamine 5'-phosphate oxidase family protein [Bacillota bacterium]|nr:pyridoxamine 5'-phosphate oxidase family protein [Bacillota bacterium]